MPCSLSLLSSLAESPRTVVRNSWLISQEEAMDSIKVHQSFGNRSFGTVFLDCSSLTVPAMRSDSWKSSILLRAKTAQPRETYLVADKSANSMVGNNYDTT